jgi:HK97 family phage portal protein
MIRSLLGLDEKRSLSFQDVFGQGLDLTMYRGTASGKHVGPESALTVSAVYGSVRILSDNVATFPVDSYIRWDGARKPFRPTPSWLAFEQGPHGKIEVLSQTMVSLLTAGNAYLALYRDPLGQVIFVEVLDPAQVTVQRAGADVRYTVNGTPGLTRMDVLHIPGMMLPGDLEGVSPITYARESIGLSMAATEYGAAFFGNGAIPGVAVEVDGPLSETGVKRLQAAWNEAHQGVGNAHKLAVLTEGAKFQKISVSPEDAQFLQTRAFQVSDIARIYGVPPHLLGDASGSTSWGSGLAEQNVAFVQHSLRPWVERIEAGLTHVMRTEGYPPGAFVKMNLDGLLRGDHERRMASYAVGIESGIYTVDEVRAWEELPPIPTSVEGEPTADARSIVEMIQKVYLGVGKVISAEEARALLNRAGAGLELPGPDLALPDLAKTAPTDSPEETA